MIRRYIKKKMVNFLEANKSAYLVCIILFICLSYANSLYSPFILDDFHSFVNDQNVFVTSLSFDSIFQLARTKFGINRFVPMITFAVDQHLANGRISQFHITNIIIHISAAISVYFLIINLFRIGIQRSLTRRVNPNLFAFVATSLWALSPVQTNAVTYIVQRMTSLSALFYTLALGIYIQIRLQNDKRFKILLIIIFSLVSSLAFTSKENSATLPVVIILVEYLFFKKNIIKDIGNKLRDKYLLFCLVGVGVFIPPFVKMFQGFISSYSIRNFTFYERILTESRVVVHYISLLIAPFPWRLNLDYDFVVSKGLISPPQTILSILFIFTTIYLAIKNRKKYPLIVFGILFFYINLIIESTVVPLEIIFEHRLYLPSVGFFIFLTAVIDIAYSRIVAKYNPDETKKAFIIVVIFVCSISSLLTTLRNYAWRDNISLYSDALSKSPNKPRALVNAGLAYGQNGQYEESIKLLVKALEKGEPGNEENIKAANNIIVSLNYQKKYYQSIEFGQKFLNQNNTKIKFGGYSLLLHNLGAAYYYTDQYDKALMYFEKSYLHDNSYDMSYAKPETVDATLIAITKIHELNDANKAMEQVPANKRIQSDIVYRELFDILMKYRKYDTAVLVVNRYKDLGVSKNSQVGNYMVKEYQKVKEKNLINITKNNIANYSLYKHDLKYRLLVKALFFCKKYYSLLNIHPYFLNKLYTAYPHDRWVLYWMEKHYLEIHNYELAERLRVTEKIAESDFTPALTDVAKLYIAQGKIEDAISVYKKILQIYPGVPNWRSLVSIVSNQTN